MSDNSCPPPPELSPAEKDDKIARILKSFGAQSCLNASGSRMSTSEGSAFWGLVEASSMDTEMTSTNLGCEQISALSNISRELENKVYCSIMRNKSKVQNIIIQTNNFNLIIAGKMSCARGIVIAQKNQSDLEAVSEMNSDMKNAIESDIKTTVDQTAEVLQTSETETGASPQGGKSFQDLLTEFKSNTTVQNIMESVNNIFNEIQQTNNLNLTIESGGELEVKDGKCEFNFENINKLIAKAVSKSVMDNIYKQLTTRGIIQTSKVKQESKNTGFASIYDKLAELYASRGISKVLMLVVVAFIVIKIFGGGGSGGGLFGGGSGGSGGSGGGASSSGSTKQVIFYFIFSITLIILGSLTIAGKIFTTNKTISISGTGTGGNKTETVQEKSTTLGIIILISGIIMLIYSGYNAYSTFTGGLLGGAMSMSSAPPMPPGQNINVDAGAVNAAVANAPSLMGMAGRMRMRR